MVVRADGGAGASKNRGQTLSGNGVAPAISRDNLTVADSGGVTVIPGQAANAAQYSYTPNAAPVGGGAGGGGGGGGGGSAAAATVAAARPSLQDYIANNFMKQQADQEGQRRLGEFDADTGRQRGLVQADQRLRQTNLQQTLDDQGESNAETMAARGLLRSGLTFQNQDKINQFGNQQRGVIDNLLSSFETNRASQRVQQEQANRQAIADAISKITDQYTTQFGA
jgi:hypothetical protein